MAGVMLRNVGVCRIAQEEIGESFIAESDQMMTCGAGERPCATHLMCFGSAFCIEHCNLPAERVVMIDPTEGDFDRLGKTWRFLIEAECGGKRAIDIKTRHFGHLDGRTVIGDGEALSQSSRRAGGTQGRKQDEHLSHACFIEGSGETGEW